MKRSGPPTRAHGRNNDGDREERVLLLKTPVLRTARAHYVGDVPLVALTQHTPGHAARLASGGAPRQRSLQFDRNFCQEFLFPTAVQGF